MAPSSRSTTPRPDQPLCIYLPLGYPHPPYGVEDPWHSQIDRDLIPERYPTPDWSKKPGLVAGIYERQGLQGWSDDRFNELRAVYYGMCARVDEQFGRVVKPRSKHSGIYDDSAIFFFSDHGDFTGDYGLVEKTQNTFEDCLTRVPLIVKPPAETARFSPASAISWSSSSISPPPPMNGPASSPATITLGARSRP